MKDFIRLFIMGVFGVVIGGSAYAILVQEELDNYKELRESNQKIIQQAKSCYLQLKLHDHEFAPVKFEE